MKARRVGPKGRGRVEMEFDDGRPPMVLSAFETRLAYRTLYASRVDARRRRQRLESEVERSLRESGVPG